VRIAEENLKKKEEASLSLASLSLKGENLAGASFTDDDNVFSASSPL
jgi:hypothetical protein